MSSRASCHPWSCGQEARELVERPRPEGLAAAARAPRALMGGWEVPEARSPGACTLASVPRGMLGLPCLGCVVSWSCSEPLAARGIVFGLERLALCEAKQLKLMHGIRRHRWGQMSTHRRYVFYEPPGRQAAQELHVLICSQLVDRMSCRGMAFSVAWRSGAVFSYG